MSRSRKTISDFSMASPRITEISLHHQFIYCYYSRILRSGDYRMVGAPYKKIKYNKVEYIWVQGCFGESISALCSVILKNYFQEKQKKKKVPRH
jgi:hypothetical protein